MKEDELFAQIHGMHGVLCAKFSRAPTQTTIHEPHLNLFTKYCRRHRGGGKLHPRAAKFTASHLMAASHGASLDSLTTGLRPFPSS
jgi:hypothetical protein